MVTGFSRNSAGVSDESVQPTVAPEGLRCVARQPILDIRGNVHGYELLFRSGPFETEFTGDGDAATRAVLDDTVLFGLERLSGGETVFVNCTQESLEQRLVRVLPPKQAVLEILETLDPTPVLLEACRELKSQGFRLALDDFEWKPEWQEFTALADYIKVDISKTSHESRLELIDKLRGTTAQLIAERVETPADLSQALREGFGLFQGFHFCRPVLVENREIPANKLVYLEMFGALAQHPLNTRRVSELIKHDPSLTYRLLRMVNSPVYGLGQVIRSIHAALVMIGDDMFRRLAILAAASELKGNQPMELLSMAFHRGRFCELAAPFTGRDPSEQYLVGILSLLPAMLNVPMERVVQNLPLRVEVRDALLGLRNAERITLEWLLCYERGEWSYCDLLAQTGSLIPAPLPRLYAEALLWAESMSLASI